MTSNNLPHEISNSELTENYANGALLDEILRAESWENAELLCFRALPSCEIYSIRPSTFGWSVEIEYDNLLHEGEGVSQAAALSDALRGILETLEFARAY